jgi:hypothetical protein
MLNKSKKPIWLASYPKSGNTWTRLFLTALLKEKEVDINNIATDGIISGRNVIDSTLGINSAEVTEKDYLEFRPFLYDKWSENHTNKEYLLVKVHDACILNGVILFPKTITRGTIYILRNPFDMAASTANHHGVSIDMAVKMLCNNKHALAYNKKSLNNQITQHLGSWSQHLISWTNIHRENMLVIKYEDMLNKGLETFSKIVHYLDLDYTNQQIQEAISEVAFNKIQEKEKQNKFREAPKHAEMFFRSGRMGGWRNEITQEQANYIVDCNYESLLKYGYINENGDILV